MVRGQFRGYRDEPGVAKDSYMVPPTPRCASPSTRGAGRACRSTSAPGKCLARTLTEVMIEFKNPPQVVFAEPAPSMGNYIRFRLSPQVRSPWARA
jgi:glucose-6-phosphate 1-dehydrogenase